ncbi:MAG TPA: hypothetical protein VL147_00470 [Devosia sp.]|nr:hypothetical protein [Devosia sp.]
MRAIDKLQTLRLVIESATGIADSQATSDISRELSILAEQGRMFFKNVPMSDFGIEKEEAYQGLRPAILDQLVFAYFVAQAWTELPDIDREAATEIVVKSENRFVSLLQREVGRKRTADRYNMEGGSGHPLAGLLLLSKQQKFPTLPEERNGLRARLLRFFRL